MDAKQAGYKIGENLRGDLRGMVSAYRHAINQSPGQKPDRIYIENRRDDGAFVRLCKTSAAWNKGTTATLDVWEEGTPPGETQSTGETIADCVNKIKYIKSGLFVIVAKAQNGSWYLVESEKPSDSGSCRAPTIGDDDLTTLPGYSASKKQALTHDQGCLKWIDIEECPTT